MATNKCRLNSNFHKCVFGQIFKYLTLLLNLSGIYVPAVCICPKEPQTSPVRSVSDKNKNNVVAVRDVDQHSKNNIFSNGIFSPRNNTKISPMPDVKKSKSTKYQCGDNCFVKFVKFIIIVVNFSFRAADIVRLIFILLITSDEDMNFVLSLIQLVIYLYLMYILLMSNITNRLNARVCISSWLEYEQNFGLTDGNKNLIKWSKYGTLFSIFFGAVQSGIASYGYLFWFDSLKSQFLPFTNEKGSWFYFGAFYFYITAAQTFYILISVNLVIFLLMRAMHGELSGLIKKVKLCFGDEIDQSKAEAKFDEFLEQLKSLLDVMDRTHDVIKHGVAACYIFVIPAFCCVLYGVISGSMEMGHILAAVFTLALATSLLIAITYGGAWVRDQITLVWSTVYASRWNQASETLLLKVSVFASQQNLQSFGISVYGMFVIDWSTFLMIGGTMLTYAVIIVQFQIDNVSSSHPFSQSENESYAPLQVL